MNFVPDPTAAEPLDEPVGQTGGVYLESTTTELAKHLKGISFPQLSYTDIYAEKPLVIVGEKTLLSTLVLSFTA